MAEVAFFHRGSRTAIIGDLIQRFSDANISGWMGMVMRLGVLVGERGSTPRDWRASFSAARPRSCGSMESTGMESRAIADRAWIARADRSIQNNRSGLELDLKRLLADRLQRTIPLKAAGMIYETIRPSWFPALQIV